MIFPDHVRRRIYLILVAVVPILSGYGLIADQMVPLWLGVIAAICGSSLAAVNTPAKPTPPEVDQ